MRRLRVLFVCMGNRARSQMAEGWLRHLAGDRFEAFSAGTAPKGLARETVAVMREVGVDVSSHRSKSTLEFGDQDFEYLITLGEVARDARPGAARVVHEQHWNVTDPAELQRQGIADIEAFRAVRDEVRSWIEAFVKRSGS